ncbi:MAG: nucleotide sugar dehydrogenase, partial [Planctomycetota bacterium]
NIYRAVNIALVNELKVILDRLGVDVWEVIEAASTKPFGYQAFYPGPGLGGHCIPVDPFYLTWVAKRVGHATKFIELAGEVNRAMPRFVVDRTAEALNDDGKPLKGSRVMIVGVAYKPDVSDIRETPAAEIITMLQKRGADVCYHDPHVPVFPAMRRYAIDLRGVPLDAKLVEAMDCVLIVTDHQAIDWSVLGAHAGLVVDTRNAMARAGAELWRGRVVKA